MGVNSMNSPRRRHRLGMILAVVAMLVATIPAAAVAQDDPDPRIGLSPGLWDAADAISGLNHEAWFEKRDGALQGTVSDLAFSGNYVYMGNYNGLQVFDVSDPTDPILKTEVMCVGSQNDPSVYGNLLFQSVEQTSANTNCTSTGTTAENRFRGVRIYDISNREVPVYVAGVQTCRGSHTHTVVEDLDDPDNVYIYVSGTAGQRAAAEVVSTPDGNVSGRCGQTVATGANPSQWMTEVIKVPLANPAAAAVVTEARLFRDPETGAVNGLQNAAPPGGHPCNSAGAPWACTPAGTTYSPTPATNTCHDITAYPDLGLAAGACQGNGILIDISDPANPVRIDAVADPNFSYWHSATLNNDGTAVLFTDEWGGGGGARCSVNHKPEWGANAIFDIVETDTGLKMEMASYYKLPVPQTNQENCVAHNGSQIPVPGRDIMVQSWYQGGISIFDWTDTSNPTKIAFFDRGPIGTGTALVSGGFWSSYWYNGYIYGSEIARGLDVLSLAPTDDLSAYEIAASNEVSWDEWNTQGQRTYGWGPSTNVVGAFRDQLARIDGISSRDSIRIDAFIEDALAATTRQQMLAAAAYGQLIGDRLDPATQGDLIDAVLLVANDLYSQARPQ